MHEMNAVDEDEGEVEVKKNSVILGSATARGSGDRQVGSARHPAPGPGSARSRALQMKIIINCPWSCHDFTNSSFTTPTVAPVPPAGQS